MKSILVVLTLVSACALSACNTVEGFGQDVQKAGEKLEDAAKKK
ncbi:MAG: Entericidin EcnA/B family [Pseudomonadota bacterium]|jgi:predicted small secreted protein